MVSLFKEENVSHDVISIENSTIKDLGNYDIDSTYVDNHESERVFITKESTYLVQVELENDDDDELSRINVRKEFFKVIEPDTNESQHDEYQLEPHTGDQIETFDIMLAIIYLIIISLKIELEKRQRNLYGLIKLT